MKAVIIGEGSGASREAVMAVYPRHTVVVDAYKARGEIIGIGPFAAGGSFILEGLIKSFVIRDWNDTMLD